jgi:hypothetical protein
MVDRPGTAWAEKLRHLDNGGEHRCQNPCLYPHRLFFENPRGIAALSHYKVVRRLEVTARNLGRGDMYPFPGLLGGSFQDAPVSPW